MILSANGWDGEKNMTEANEINGGKEKKEKKEKKEREKDGAADLGSGNGAKKSKKKTFLK